MLRMFGLGEGESSEIGWGQEAQEGVGALDREEVLMPYLRALSAFRDGVRQLAISKGDGAAKDILALCDRLRDQDLVPLGVALDDQEGMSNCHTCVACRFLTLSADGKALVKLVPPAQLIEARDEKRKAAEAKAASKAAAVAAEREKRIKALEKGRVPPEQMFRPPNVPEGTYSSWSEDGLPLTDSEGKELSKNASKSVAKAHKAQKLAHEKFLKWQEEGGA